MLRNRRSLLKFIGTTVLLPASGLSALLKPLVAFADWNTKAFWAGKQDDAIKNMFPDQTIAESDSITLSMHEFIENGSIVPIKIKTELPNVSSISIFVEKNPNPLIAHFELNPRCLGFVSTRLKIDQPSNVMAVVKSGGQLFSKSQYVEVAEGGCG